MLHVVGTSGWTAGCGEAPEYQVGRLMWLGRGLQPPLLPCPIAVALGPLWVSSLAFCPHGQGWDVPTPPSCSLS